MIRKLFVLWLLFVWVSAVYAEEDNILAKVEGSARSWFEWVDNGKYQESWERASSLLKTKATEAEWVKSMTAIRLPRGEMTARYIATAGATKTLSGYPDGEYVVLQFYTTFVQKGLALETVTLAKMPDETWQVVEYTMK